MNDVFERPAYGTFKRRESQRSRRRRRRSAAPSVAVGESCVVQSCVAVTRMEGKEEGGRGTIIPLALFPPGLPDGKGGGGGSGRERAVEVSAVRQRQAAFEVGQVWK